MAGESYTTKKILLKAVSGSTTQYFIPYINNAAADKTGLVKPDGTTTTVDANGVLSVIHQTIKQDGVTGATINRYGSCSTAAATAQKEVSLTSGSFSLEAGARVTVNFANANTASTPTLKVGSNTAKNIYFGGSQITTSDAKKMLSGVVDFVYDGTQFNIVDCNWESYLTAQLDALTATLNAEVAEVA